MGDDIRIAVGFFTHPKTLRLQRKGGSDAVLGLLRLWAWCRVNRPRGVLTDLDAEDVADAAGWAGNPDEFVGWLVQCKWLEKKPDSEFALYDWRTHQPWAFHS